MTHSVLAIEQWNTPQGVPVYFIQAPQIPMLDIRIIFNAGSVKDKGQSGLANLTFSLLDEGTLEWSADEIATQFDTVGAIYKVIVRHDFAYVCLRSLTDPKLLKAALDTLRQVISNPALDDAAFERIQKQTLIGLEEELQHPTALAEKAFYGALYQDHPYAHPLSGNIQTVQQLTPQMVRDFYKRYCVTKNISIALVGDITPAYAHQITDYLMDSLPQGQNATPTSLATSLGLPVTQTIAFPSQQTTVYLGQLGIRPQDPNFFALEVGNYILGGGGMVSRLFHQLREKRGLVYGIYSTFTTLLGIGPFYIQLQTRNDQAVYAATLTKELLTQFIQQGPIADEVVAAQKNLIGSFALNLAGNTNILANLVRLIVYQLPLDYLDTYRNKIAAVTPQQVFEAFEKHISNNQLLQVSVGQAS